MIVSERALLRRDLAIAYALALSAAADWALFLRSMIPWMDLFAMAWILMTIPLLVWSGLIAPVVWLIWVGRMFTRHSRPALAAVPGVALVAAGPGLIVLLYRDFTCGAGC